MQSSRCFCFYNYLLVPRFTYYVCISRVIKFAPKKPLSTKVLCALLRDVTLTILRATGMLMKSSFLKKVT